MPDQAYFDGLPQTATAATWQMVPFRQVVPYRLCNPVNDVTKGVEGNITDVNCFRAVEHRIGRFSRGCVA